MDWWTYKSLKKIKKHLERLENVKVCILEMILDRLNSIERKADEFMATVKTDLDALRLAVDTATNEVAARIDRLSQGIKNSMTDEEVAAVKAGFQGEIDRLTALGQDPVVPVPPVPAPLAALRAK